MFIGASAVLSVLVMRDGTGKKKPRKLPTGRSEELFMDGKRWDQYECA